MGGRGERVDGGEGGIRKKEMTEGGGKGKDGGERMEGGRG